ncbi:MAG: spore maturation protein [Oscillospiraceae bacterium]
MKLFGELVIPLTLCFVVVYALFRGSDVFTIMSGGAREGLKTMAGIVPALIVLLPCIAMFRASGALEALCGILSPILGLVGIPSETVALMLLRPLSGSGALAVAGDIMKNEGVNSYIGRCAAVMLGSTETTFYVIAVYFGAAGIRKSRHAIPAALVADFVGFAAAAFFVKVVFGG